MKQDLFDFDFSRWEVILLSVLPAITNLIVFLYSYTILDKNRTTSYFSIFVLLLGLWQMADGFMKFSKNSETASEWYRISGIFLLFVIPFGLKFILHLVHWYKKNSRLLSVLLFLPPLIFFVFISARLDEFEILKARHVYWLANPLPTQIMFSIYIWTALGAIAMLVILWIHYVKTRDFIRKKQALLLAVGLTIPIICGVILEIFFPLILGYNTVPITTFLMSVFSVTSVLAIKKYRLLDYSPRHQWHQIVETMNEGILIVNNEDRIQYANPAFCKILGYELEELKNKKAFEVLVGEEEKHIIISALQERKKGNSGQYEIMLKTKTGEWITMLVSGSPYYDKQGKVIGSIGVQTNITYLKEAEKALAYNEMRLRQAQEVAHVGSWEVSLLTKKAIMSEEACKMYGIPPEAKATQSFETWLQFIHPDDLPAVKKEIEKSEEALSGCSIKYRIIRSDGSVRHIHSVSRFELNESGQPSGIYGICHDITEQVESEKALKESEECMRTFINESLLSIYFVDLNTKKIIYSNPALSELLGYSQEELKGFTPYSFINHSSEDIDECIDQVVKNKKIYNGERQWKRKDGKIVHVLASSFYHKKDGTDIIFVTAQDITERKLAEEKLKTTNDELRTFIYKASHDIRGPLASVLGLVSVGKKEIKDPTSLEYLEMIDNTTQKLDYILIELVRAMRIKDVEMFSDQIDFNSLTDDILKRFHHIPGYQRLNVDTRIKNNGTFFSNRSIIETILQNLVENSIKYQNTNEPKPFLRIEITDDEKEASIVVEDNGIGMEESVQPHIFNMYFRGTTVSKGSGLGLYLVKKGIDKLNGEISLESKYGSGSKFVVRIPSQTMNIDYQRK